jgi:hypothetical protein
VATGLGPGPAPTQPMYAAPVSGEPPTYNPAQAPDPARGYGAGQTPGTALPYEATQVFRATRAYGAPAPASGAPRIYGAQAYGGPAGHVPLGQKRWLLPAAIGVLVVGLLTGGVMAAFALPSGDAKTTPNAARPLPGDITDPSQPPAQTPTADPTPTPTPTPTAAPIPPPTTGIRLVSNWNGKCIDVPGANYADGVPLQVYNCNGTSDQAWTFTGGAVKTQNNLCMDVAGGSTANGAAIQIATCSGDPAQQLVLSAAGDLVNRQANKCVDIKDSNGNDGAKLQLWDCAGTANQKWHQG